MPRSLQPGGDSKLMAPKQLPARQGPCQCLLQLSKLSQPRGGEQQNKLSPSLQSTAYASYNRPVCQQLQEGKTPQNNSFYTVSSNSKLPKRLCLTTVLPAKGYTLQILLKKQTQKNPTNPQPREFRLLLMNFH